MDARDKARSAPRDGLAHAGGAIFTLGGLGAAFGAASCCGLPFALASAGLGSAWLSGIALFAAPHRQVLLLVAAAGLAAGAMLLLLRRRRVAACAVRERPNRPSIRAAGLVALLLGLVLLTLGVLYG